MFIKNEIKMKQRDRLYFKFEKLLDEGSTDSDIKNVLLQFKEQDFKELPIIFDLIALKRIVILTWLYERGIPFSYKDDSGATVLHMASAVSGNIESVIFLFNHAIDTDVNAQNDEGETPFILAVLYEHTDIVRYFLQHAHPDFTLQTIYKEDVRSLAQESDNKEIIALLQERDKI